MATLAITGIRLGEAVALTIGSLAGPAGERRLSVVGKGDEARVVPIYPALEPVLAANLDTRATRFPGQALFGGLIANISLAALCFDGSTVSLGDVRRAWNRSRAYRSPVWAVFNQAMAPLGPLASNA